MEENVALDSKKQKKFDKSIKGIKKLLKKNDDKPHKPAVLAPKDEESKGGKKKRNRPERGLVYLSHIPHGFYEHEMTQYFKQFGMVTNVRVIRSPRTGQSKGYAFVQFREPAVAEIVAETMNNYLMGKRLIKAAIIPPEKQRHKAFRKHWSSQHNPTAVRRTKARKAHNSIKTDEKYLKSARNILSNLEKTKKKLKELGINYDFFKPVDVPEALLENVKVKSESEKTVKINNEAKEKLNEKKKTKVEKTKEKVAKAKKSETTQSKSTDTKSKKDAKKIKESDKVKQNDKQKKMQDAGVKLPENFIKIAAESGEDSDSSLDFDSDEYEKMLENDSDASSGDESEDEEEDDGSDDEECEEDIPDPIPIKQKKGKTPLVGLPPPSKKAAKPGTVPKVQEPQPPKKGPKPFESEDEDEDDGSDDEESEDIPDLIPIKQKKGKTSVVVRPPPSKKAAKPGTVPKVQKPQPPKKGPKPANVAQGQKPPVQQRGAKRKNPQTGGSPKKPKFEKKDKARNKQFKKKNKA